MVLLVVSSLDYDTGCKILMSAQGCAAPEVSIMNELQSQFHLLLCYLLFKKMCIELQLLLDVQGKTYSENPLVSTYRRAQVCYENNKRFIKEYC